MSTYLVMPYGEGRAFDCRDVGCRYCGATVGQDCRRVTMIGRDGRDRPIYATKAAAGPHKIRQRLARGRKVPT